MWSFVFWSFSVRFHQLLKANCHISCWCSDVFQNPAGKTWCLTFCCLIYRKFIKNNKPLDPVISLKHLYLLFLLQCELLSAFFLLPASAFTSGTERRFGSKSQIKESKVHVCDSLQEDHKPGDVVIKYFREGKVVKNNLLTFTSVSGVYERTKTWQTDKEQVCYTEQVSGAVEPDPFSDINSFLCL